MNDEHDRTWIAFAGSRRIAGGPPAAVAAGVKRHVDADPDAQVLVFDATSSRPVEIDLRGSLPEVLARLPNGLSATAPEPAPEARPPGRPRLGVVGREVTLLPRHWTWLASQPGGASVALRKLVESALRDHRDADRVRAAREAVYRFMTAMAGNEPGFEEATRALFAGDLERLSAMLVEWPGDVRQHVETLAQASRDEAVAASDSR